MSSEMRSTQCLQSVSVAMEQQSQSVLDQISAFEVQNIRDGSTAKIGSFWLESDCVIVFLRRFGCLFTRMWAKQLSEISSTLQASNVRLVGISCDPEGAEDFLSHNFFSGEVYVDASKKVYEKMQFKRYNPFSLVAALLSPTSVRAIFSGAKNKIPVDFKGDYYQIGGVLIVRKPGKLLHHFQQENIAEHLPNERILEVLQITAND